MPRGIYPPRWEVVPPEGMPIVKSAPWVATAGNIKRSTLPNNPAFAHTRILFTSEVPSISRPGMEACKNGPKAWVI